MCFILLSIASFVLRTLPIFEVVDYDFIDAYIGENSTEQTLVNNLDQRELVSGFDTIEWICI